MLPSSDVVQVSASQFSTGFVGQTAAQTRDIFESARGAVLFIDEAYRLYDPAGRSYMQEAIDEIVNLLTEEQYRGKMAVIFAGYSGQMSDMLDKVNPGLKSRVSDVIDFPDFSAGEAAEIAAAQLDAKGLTLPAGAGADALTSWTRRLVAAPAWANGRDVETFVRRAAIECATRKTAEVTPEASTRRSRPSSRSRAATARRWRRRRRRWRRRSRRPTRSRRTPSTSTSRKQSKPLRWTTTATTTTTRSANPSTLPMRSRRRSSSSGTMSTATRAPSSPRSSRRPSTAAPFPEELRAKVAAKTGATRRRRRWNDGGARGRCSRR